MNWRFWKEYPAAQAGQAGVSAPPQGHAASSSLAAATETTAEVEALLTELREAARRAGIQRDDPMMPLLSAFAQQIRFLSKRNDTFTPIECANYFAAAGYDPD